MTYPDLRAACGDGDACLGAPKVAGTADGVLVVAAGLHEVALVLLVLDVSAPAVDGGVAVTTVLADLLSGRGKGDRGGEGRGDESELHGEEGEMRRWVRWW